MQIKLNAAACQDIVAVHEEIKNKIEERIISFQKLWEKGSEQEIFEELIFCLLTPQTKARQGEKAIAILKNKNLILQGSEKEISKHLNIVRFRHKKAHYIVNAQKKFLHNGKPIIKKTLKLHSTPHAMREFLVKEVKGFGWKEASHFLRNIGIGKNLAILDRHILKNLVIAGCINRIPPSFTKKRYLAIEKQMHEFAHAVKIPFAHLDFVLWYMETGDIFK
ncbi:MAG: N-glycosylase/DNA lyase [Spirochaetes bacterium]|nr:N-glycosylase/DNA lyase [Spirochaetota bacterium]